VLTADLSDGFFGWTGGHEAFRRLGADEQMPFVERYFQPYAGKGFITVGDVQAAIDRAVGDLNTWDKKASSLIVYKDGDPPPRTTIVVLDELANLDSWDGPSHVFSVANGTQAVPDFPLRSAHVPAGMVLSIYPGTGFTGTPVNYSQDTMNVGEHLPGQYSFVVRDTLAPANP
jgi:hypothetical protein